MSTQNNPHILRGILAGIAGGLVASWMMNEFLAGPGAQLTKALNTPEENAAAAKQDPEARQDATMITADKIVETVTGGQHLTWSQQKEGGPIVHYSFGALMGGIYGGLAEYSSLFSSGYGTGFGSALFASADLLAVPAFHLSAPLDETPVHTLATPYAAHLVYGATTELVRRFVRKVL
jgi:putative membrane protein